MATDIAFSVGVLGLLGRRVPGSARTFLLALAIADDIGAIVVIAVFYSAGVHRGPLLVAAGIWAAIVVMNRVGVRSVPVHLRGGWRSGSASASRGCTRRSPG